jgi:hypothetical protein
MDDAVIQGQRLLIARRRWNGAVCSIRPPLWRSLVAVASRCRPCASAASDCLTVLFIGVSFFLFAWRLFFACLPFNRFFASWLFVHFVLLFLSFND